MNDAAPGADCRFTYYKTNALFTGTLDGDPAIFAAHPPAPINCAIPAQVGSTTGWMRSYCNSPQNRLTERDWLTYLWALNGSASGAQKLTMANLMYLFAKPAGYPTTRMNWSNMYTLAAGLGPTKQAWVFSRGSVHGAN